MRANRLFYYIIDTCISDNQYLNFKLNLLWISILHIIQTVKLFYMYLSHFSYAQTFFFGNFSFFALRDVSYSTKPSEGRGKRVTMHGSVREVERFTHYITPNGNKRITKESRREIG